LPDTIRFWKTRIEKVDADATFAVVVMYGPSGCGKSSLLKAGLLPRLASHVLPIFIEATPNAADPSTARTINRIVSRICSLLPIEEKCCQSAALARCSKRLRWWIAIVTFQTPK
jgi:hypothetical protein